MNDAYEVLPAGEDEVVDVWLANQRQQRKRRLLRVAVGMLLAASMTTAMAAKLRYDRLVETRGSDLATIESKVAILVNEQTRRASELKSLQTSIDSAREEILVEKRRASIAKCEAANAALDASVALERARCFQESARNMECAATNSKAEADGVVGGLLVGGALALATGGASLAAGAALGATGGAAMAEREECTVVDCTTDDGAIEARLIEHGHEQRRHCDRADQVTLK